jgi:hypothetical protein
MNRVSCHLPAPVANEWLALPIQFCLIQPDVVGTVAPLTESELVAVSETAYTATLVNRDSAMRRAKHWDVQLM